MLERTVGVVGLDDPCEDVEYWDGDTARDCVEKRPGLVDPTSDIEGLCDSVSADSSTSLSWSSLSRSSFEICVSLSCAVDL